MLIVTVEEWVVDGGKAAESEAPPAYCKYDMIDNDWLLQLPVQMAACQTGWK